MFPNGLTSWLRDPRRCGPGMRAGTNAWYLPAAAPPPPPQHTRQDTTRHQTRAGYGGIVHAALGHQLRGPSTFCLLKAGQELRRRHAGAGHGSRPTPHVLPRHHQRRRRAWNTACNGQRRSLGICHPIVHGPRDLAGGAGAALSLHALRLLVACALLGFVVRSRKRQRRYHRAGWGGAKQFRERSSSIRAAVQGCFLTRQHSAGHGTCWGRQCCGAVAAGTAAPGLPPVTVLRGSDGRLGRTEIQLVQPAAAAGATPEAKRAGGPPEGAIGLHRGHLRLQLDGDPPA